MAEENNRKKEEIENQSKSSQEIRDEDEELKKQAPTQMKHNFLIRPFETLTRMYGVPTYSEIDPTAVLAFTFPLIFGLMFGDIGHGLVLIISGIHIRSFFTAFTDLIDRPKQRY